MGIAAYNRGSEAIRRSLADGKRPVEFEMMERLNGLEKYPDCGMPNRPLVLQYDLAHNIWWAFDAKKRERGYGYCYPTLTELVRRWSIDITAYDAEADTWYAVPRPQNGLSALYASVFGTRLVR